MKKKRGFTEVAQIQLRIILNHPADKFSAAIYCLIYTIDNKTEIHLIC